LLTGFLALILHKANSHCNTGANNGLIDFLLAVSLQFLKAFNGGDMQSSLIGKIEKSKRYAEEKERITFTGLSVNFQGENDDHTLNYQDGKWNCSCNFFSKWGECSHSMAMQRILAEMLPSEAISPELH
jgi:hypothetical protein